MRLLQNREAMKPWLKTIIVVIFFSTLMVLALWLQPQFYFRNSYQPTTPDKLAATKPPAWTIGMSAAQMCSTTEGGDSPEYRGTLYKHYAHLDEMFDHKPDGTHETVTVICSFPDEHSVRYHRWDWRMTGYAEIEILWHGFRQRGDVSVPNTLF